MSRFANPCVALDFLNERLTYEQIAELLAVDQTTLWRTRNGITKPRRSLVKALKNAATEEQKKRRKATREGRKHVRAQ